MASGLPGTGTGKRLPRPPPEVTTTAWLSVRAAVTPLQRIGPRRPVTTF
jgi:hypothetical protein